MDPQKTNILVLDGESEIRVEINEFLTSRNIQVQEASTPPEAFRFFSVHPIHFLHEPTECIPLLFAYYHDYYSQKLRRDIQKVKKEIMDALLQYDFPGNVRELMHIVERAPQISWQALDRRMVKLGIEKKSNSKIQSFENNHYSVHCIAVAL